jgi:hypothetical protein
LFLTFEIFKSFVKRLKQSSGTEFVDSEGNVTGEKCCHGDGDDCHIVWFEPFVDFRCFDFLDVLIRSVCWQCLIDFKLETVLIRPIPMSGVGSRICYVGCCLVDVR